MNTNMKMMRKMQLMIYDGSYEYTVNIEHDDNDNDENDSIDWKKDETLKTHDNDESAENDENSEND